jgi:hypothetical protein
MPGHKGAFHVRTLPILGYNAFLSQVHGALKQGHAESFNMVQVKYPALILEQALQTLLTLQERCLAQIFVI